MYIFLPVICKVPVVVLRKGKTVGSAPASQDGRPDHFFFYCFAYAHAMEIGGGEEARAVDVDNNVIEESDRERWQGRTNLVDSSAEQLSKVLQTRRR